MLGPVFAGPLTMAASYLWPAYQTYKAIGLGNPQILREWCMYWLVLAFFVTIQWITDATLFWLPLYYEAKLIAVLFLWHPRTKGAVYVYERFLLPLLQANESRIDSGLEESKAWLADSMNRQLRRARSYATENTGTILEHMRSFSEQKRVEGPAKAAYDIRHIHHD